MHKLTARSNRFMGEYESLTVQPTKRNIVAAAEIKVRATERSIRRMQSTGLFPKKRAAGDLA
jgi:hypothetical protein